MLDLRRLKVLREVALRGSFSAAATELLFSPSAVSQQIAQLEREVGMPLVERKSTGIELTRAGQLLVGHANAILARAADAEEELRQLDDGAIGQLFVGAFASATASLMPEIVPTFRGTHPRTEIRLVEQDRTECLDGLRHGELDLAVVVAAPEPASPGVVEMPLLDDTIDVLLPLNHRLADAPAVTLDELGGEPWADCSGSPVLKHFAALGIEPEVVFRSDHHRVVEGIVAAGVAVGFIPRLAQPVHRQDVVVKSIAPPAPTRPVGLAARPGDHRAAVATVIDLMKNLVAVRDDKRAPIPLRRAARQADLDRPQEDRRAERERRARAQ